MYDVTSDEYFDIVDANEMRQITITPEEHYRRKFTAHLNDLMSSMTIMAERNGKFEYSVTLAEKYDEKLFTDITKVLEKAGYKVTIEPLSETQKTFKVDWSQQQ